MDIIKEACMFKIDVDSIEQIIRLWFRKINLIEFVEGIVEFL